MILYMYIAPGRGRQPPGDEVLMSTEIVSKKSIVLPFSHTKAQGTKFDIVVK